MSAPYESSALQSQTAKFTVKLITTNSFRMCPPLTIGSNGVFLNQITNNFFLPLNAAINTLFSPTKKVCTEISLRKFFTQVIKGTRKKFSSNLSFLIPTFDSKRVNVGFLMDKKALGYLPENISVFPVSNNP
jgi:hypothetical protein